MTKTDDLLDASTGEVLSMITSNEDIVFGRMPVGMDESDFDALPTHEAYMDTPPYAEDTESDVNEDFVQGEEMPAPFESPGVDKFPVFMSALREFQAAERPSRVVRIDTDETYGDFVCEQAVKELSRRVDELRTALEEHESDLHGPKAKPLRKWEVLGAAQAVSDLRAASTTDEATKALPQVPLDLPAFAEGKVKCWRDGDDVICSIRFAAADGTARVATMATRPRADSDDVARWAMSAGVDPVTVLGMLPDLASVACGKKLVKDVAGAALAACRRVDVLGATEPLLLASPGTEGKAPLAALMHLIQRSQAGDKQARRELKVIETAAGTPSGRAIAVPLLKEAGKRLGAAQEAKARKRTFAEKYTLMSGWL
jgi:hypothetical protein